MASQITSLTIVYSIYRRRSKKTSKLRVTGLCAGKSPLTWKFAAKMASNPENVSVLWHHHDLHFAHWESRKILDMVDQFYGTTSVYIGFNLCLLYFQELPVPERGSQDIHHCFHWFQTIIWRTSPRSTQNPFGFKTWMGFVQWILMILSCHPLSVAWEWLILEVGVTSHAQIRHIVLGCLASFSLFVMFNLCACNVCENRRTITKFSEST